MTKPIIDTNHTVGQDDVHSTSTGPEESELDSSDNASETSTIVYGHDAFETFQHRVRELLSEVFLPETSTTAVITRLRGGSFNRIVGISLGDNEKDLILRIPRFEGVDVALQVQILSWLASSTHLPVPKIVGHDTTSDNAIGDPYVLMERLEGRSLHSVIDEMSDEQRVSMAKQVAALIGSIHSAPVPPGIGPLALDHDGRICVGRFSDGEDTPSTERDDIPAPSTFYDFLSMRFTEQRNYCLEHWPDDLERISYCDKLLHAAQVLLGSTNQQSRTSLFHRDFAARNILVENVAEDSSSDPSWIIAGVLDWDDCEVAPVEVAYVCPGWLWAGRGEPEASDSFDENDWDPDLPPYDGLSARIRDVFFDSVESIIPGFVDTIRSSRKLHLRKLYELARTMMCSNADEQAANLVIATAEQHLAAQKNPATGA